MYSMFRSDGAGDSGGASEALWIDRDGHVQMEQDARPRVGVVMRVGSLYARSLQAQDWWMTSPITRIVSDEGTRVIFETLSGSTYEWRTPRRPATSTQA